MPDASNNDERRSSALGMAAEAPHFGFPSVAFPFLTHLDLSRCMFPTVPPAVLSMPRLRVLNLTLNRLRELPGDLGQRLPRLREISLRSNLFSAFPLRALAGAASLEKIDVSRVSLLQIQEPLDSLVDSLPRMRETRMSGRATAWTRDSRAHLERFAARLRARDPAAVVEF